MCVGLHAHILFDSPAWLAGWLAGGRAGYQPGFMEAGSVAMGGSPLLWHGYNHTKHLTEEHPKGADLTNEIGIVIAI